MHLTLIRDYQGPDCTLGTLLIGTTGLQTLELPWVPIDGAVCGEPDKSCAPSGDYALVPHDSVKHPRSFALVAPALNVYHQPQDVPPDCIARTDVLLHVANEVAQLLGCIGVGMGRAMWSNERVITDSGAAYKILQSLVPWMPGHTLTITRSALAA